MLPLRENDIRREVYDAEGMKAGEVTELVVALKPPTRRTGAEPCRTQDGASYYDAPYRDGAHACWDAEALGGIPVFVIDVQGQAIWKPNVLAQRGGAGLPADRLPGTPKFSDAELNSATPEKNHGLP